MRFNPVLARELRELMRSRRAPISIALYLLVLTGLLKMTSGFTNLTGRSMTCINGRCFEEANVLMAASSGRVFFHSLLFFTLCLVCFFVPGLTASAIAGERERQTLVPLLVTRMTPRSIVTGKLLSSLAFTLLLLIATLPLLSAVFWVGGVSPGEVIRGTAMIVLSAITIGAIAIVVSTYVRRVQPATVAAYGLAFALCVGPFAVYGVAAMQSARLGSSDRPNPAVLAISPFVATAEVVRGEAGAASLPTPFSALQSLMHGDRFGPGGIDRSPYWILSVLAFAGLTVGGVALATIRLTTPSQRGPRA